MSEPVIRVNKLGKRYRIGAKQGEIKNIREAVLDIAKAPIRNFRRLRNLTNFKDANPGEANDIIWALKDVSFEVKQGEIVGIIGRNGAGKSTLLKILTRITEPTEGYAEMRGRVSSLLEVGTGFHPELTGRENVYLNGSILGMRKWEIDKKFDQIVAFAEVEKFIDTPVKRYSSGMKVRLAFAVAAHLEPEVLLIDEVLAVGDVAFQKKCLGKMDEVAKGGRTVLFVSHNMGAILSLCNKCYLLDYGRIVCNGDTEEVVAKYMQNISSTSAIPLHQRIDRKGNGRARLTSFSIKNVVGLSSIQCSDRLHIRIGYIAKQELSKATFLVGIYDHFNRPIFFLNSEEAGGVPDILPASGFITCVTSPINITPGSCVVNIAILLGGVIADHVGHVCTFEVQADNFYGTGKLTHRQTALCLLCQEWKVERDNSAKNSS